MKLMIFFIKFLMLINAARSYDILGIFPHPGKSHFDVFEPLMKELAKKGHKVTVISYFAQKKPFPNYEDVNLKNTAPILVNAFQMDDIKQSRLLRYYEVMFLSNLGITSCLDAFNATDFKAFIKAERKFDVIIIEFFNSECFLGLVHNLKSPFIGVTTSAMLPWNYPKIGNPSNPAYIPNLFLPFSDKMTFFERLENSVMSVFQDIIYGYYRDVKNYGVAKTVFGDNLPPLRDIANNVSVFFVNSHFTVNLPKPSVPALIEVGGLHIGKHKNLPKNIEKWIKESTHGVIYFSLGSMIKGHTFPEEKRQMFLRVFGSLPQRVLWKWETEMLGKPDNVMIESWMPQFDILCHPNVKAFISHGGLLGTTEAVHCGVPMVVMPQFGDQFTNAKAVEASGGGVVLDFRSLSEDSIREALQAVLDPSFNEKAKALSARFRDRPLPPLDTAIYWVEYVARHGGAPHMRTAAVGMPFFRYLLLDVALFLTILGLIYAYIQFLVAKWLYYRIFGENTPPEKEKKN